MGDRKTPQWDECAALFEPDGALKDLYVLEASIELWERFARALPDWGYPVALRYADGVRPPFTTDVRPFLEPRGPEDPLPPSLSIDLAGVVLMCHFFAPAQIELDLDPREVLGPRELAMLVRFMERLGHVTQKPVRMTPEMQPYDVLMELDPATQEWTIWPRR